MNHFKYHQKLFSNTKFVELTCLIMYCEINNIDYKFIAKARTKDSFNLFPDFKINGKNLEVTRALTELEGKQMGDIQKVFSRKDKKAAVKEMNETLERYKQKGYDHGHKFVLTDKCVYTTSGLTNYNPANTIASAIRNKYEYFFNKSILSADLFVCSFDCLRDNELCLIDLFIKQSIKLIGRIYLSFLYSDDSNNNYVAVFNGTKYVLVCLHNLPSLEKRTDEIFQLGWLNKDDFKL